jgi:hypothetical protein
VTATVVYFIVTLPPITSTAAPVLASTFATLSGGSQVRPPWVGIRSSNSSRV